jgi:hypothetical protein
MTSSFQMPLKNRVENACFINFIFFTNPTERLVRFSPYGFGFVHKDDDKEIKAIEKRNPNARKYCQG